MPRRFSKRITPNRVLGISNAKRQFTKMTGGRALRNPKYIVTNAKQRYKRRAYSWLSLKGNNHADYQPAPAKDQLNTTFTPAQINRWGIWLFILIALPILALGIQFNEQLFLAIGALLTAAIIIWVRLRIAAIKQPQIPEDQEYKMKHTPRKPKEKIESTTEIYDYNWRNDPLITKHSQLTDTIRQHYANRANPNALNQAIAACYQQINIAYDVAERMIKLPFFNPLPMHIGYEQLCIIRHKQGDYDEVIKLSQQAQAQGWAGSWDNRIARAQKMLAKIQVTATPELTNITSKSKN